MSVCRSCVSSSSVQRPPIAIPRWCPVRAWLFFTLLPTYLALSLGPSDFEKSLFTDLVIEKKIRPMALCALVLRERLRSAASRSMHACSRFGYTGACVGAQTASAAVCQRMWWSSCPLRPSRTSCPHEKRRRAGEPRRRRPSGDQSASGTALGACMSPGLRRLCHRVAVRRQRRISPLARGDERSSVHSNRLEEGENNFTASAPSERRQAALRASPVAARLGPSPRGLARCTGRPLEHVLCARGRVTSRSH